MTGILASVQSVDEAKIVLHEAVDIIDLKEPSQGVLGALAKADVAAIVQHVNGQARVSATVGDIPVDSAILQTAVISMHDTGVDYVKVGVFGESLSPSFLKTVERAARQGVNIVLVCFAETLQCLPDAACLAATGIAGLMLDTQNKRSGSLTDKLSHSELMEFVNRTSAAGLICGLAGSLGYHDVETLLGLQPDYLGFRGALCKNHDRIAGLDVVELQRMKQLFVAYKSVLPLVEEHRV